MNTLFWPLAHTPGREFQGYLDSGLMLIFMLGVIVVVAGAARRCLATLRGDSLPLEAAGPPALAEAPRWGAADGSPARRRNILVVELASRGRDRLEASDTVDFLRGFKKKNHPTAEAIDNEARCR